jgi:transcriptional regulator with XRE-family HTH domain
LSGYEISVSNPVTKSFSEQMKAFRGEMSYAQFATKLGITKSLAHKLETSGEGATLDTVFKIACALGLSVEEVLGTDAVRRKRSRRG